MIFSASADLLNARGMIKPRALHKSADAEKITIKLQVTDIYISNFSQTKTLIDHAFHTIFVSNEMRIFFFGEPKVNHSNKS